MFKGTAPAGTGGPAGTGPPTGVGGPEAGDGADDRALLFMYNICGTGVPPFMAEVVAVVVGVGELVPVVVVVLLVLV